LRRAIATVSLSGPLQEKLQAIAAAKFDAIELCENDLLFYDGSPRSVRDMVVDLGLKIAVFQPFRDFEGVPDAVFRKGLDRASRKFDVMAELGAPLMLVCTNVTSDALDDDARAAAQLHELAELASRRGLKIGYQALAWGRHVKTADHAAKIVGQACHPHLGVALNSFHTLAAGQDRLALASIPGDKIFWVQLADAPNLGMDLRSWSRHFSSFPGQGDLDVAGFVRQVFDTGYSGALSLEALNDEFQASPARSVAADGMRSLIWVEEQVRAEIDAEGQKPGASHHFSQLPDASPRPDILGLAFLEFAVGGGADTALAAQLVALGFRKVGRHHSKAVTLYRQGDLAIALNAEQESFAYSFHLMHGSSVCALGLRVADVPGFLARAELYGYERFEGRTDAGDKPMPAIRRPDGSLFYILAADFDASAEFVAEEEGEDLNVLAGFDHIGEAVAARQMDSWLLFYRAVLGLDPAQSWDLPDPYGLVRSRAMANPSRTMRLPLSFSDSARTSVARALTSFIGAGVNQIAFSTHDIYGAVEMLRAHGATFVEISSNYYEDLASRLDLSNEVVDRLKRCNLLYDQDDRGGAFLHAYTEVFQGRFFFEVVQRTGGYDNYGASNAAVRMAAQTRANPISSPF
jgi:4-hydroxyphenylpyruvate dioxygenase